MRGARAVDVLGSSRRSPDAAVDVPHREHSVCWQQRTCSRGAAATSDCTATAVSDCAAAAISDCVAAALSYRVATALSDRVALATVRSTTGLGLRPTSDGLRDANLRLPAPTYTKCSSRRQPRRSFQQTRPLCLHQGRRQTRVALQRVCQRRQKPTVAHAKHGDPCQKTAQADQERLHRDPRLEPARQRAARTRKRDAGLFLRTWTVRGARAVDVLGSSRWSLDAAVDVPHREHCVCWQQRTCSSGAATTSDCAAAASDCAAASISDCVAITVSSCYRWWMVYPKRRMDETAFLIGAPGSESWWSFQQTRSFHLRESRQQIRMEVCGLREWR